MMNRCFYCKGETEPSTRTHVVDLKQCIVIIRNVPCFTCVRCGESFYTDDVQKRLDEIVRSVRGLMTEVTILEYTETAA